MKASGRGGGWLFAWLTLSCAAADPYYVESPLARSKPSSSEATPPAVTIERPRRPHVDTSTLPNGMRASVVERPGSGLVTLIYVNQRARMSEDYLPVFVGDALLAGVRRPDGNVVYPVVLAGMSPRVQTGADGTTIAVTCTAQLFDAAVSLLADVVQRPVFDPTWMVPVRSRTTLDLLGVRNSYWEWTLAAQHRGEPFDLDEERVAEGLRLIDQAGLLAAHHALFTPSDSALVVVGDVPVARAKTAFSERFSGWLEPASQAKRATASAVRATQAAAPPAAAARKGRQLIVAADKGYPRVTLIQNAPAIAADDDVAFALLESVLESQGASSLLTKLRFQRAHAYYVNAHTVTVPEHGRYLFLQTAVPAETLVSDLEAMLQTLEQRRTTLIDPASLAAAKAHYHAGLASRLSSSAGLAQYLAAVQQGALPSLEAIGAHLETTTAEDVRRVAARYLQPTTATIVVTGEVANAMTALASLGEVSPWH